MGTGWVLLADTLAGGQVFLSLTVLLLWTKLHSSRLTPDYGRIGTDLAWAGSVCCAELIIINPHFATALIWLR